MPTWRRVKYIEYDYTDVMNERREVKYEEKGTISDTHFVSALEIHL